MKLGKQSAFINTNFSEQKKVKDHLYNIDRDLANIFLALQGRVRFGDGSDASDGENVHGEFQVISDSGSADTEITLAHGLGSTPVGFLVINIDKGGVVYDSGTAWTSSNMYLKCSAANAAITLFLLK